MARDLFEDGPTPRRAGRDLLAGVESGPGFNGGAFLDTLKDLPRYGGMALNSFSQGAGDLVTGAGQLMSHAIPNAVGDPLARAADYVSGGTGEAPESFSGRFDTAMRERERQYQQERGGYANTPDVGRFTGNVVAGGALGQGAAAVTLPGRMMQGAKITGGIGLTQPVDPGQEQSLGNLVTGRQEAPNYWGKKAVQVGGSAVLGFLAPPVVEGLIHGVGATVNALSRGAHGLGRTMSGQTAPAAIEGTLSAELQRSGVSWTQLPQEMRASLVGEVQKSLKAGGGYDPDAIRRLADFQRLNIQPTQGQLTRDPLQFAREQNYAKLEVGQPIAQRLTQQNQQLLGTLNDVRGNLGAGSSDAYSAGQRVIGGLRAQDASRRGAVDAAYTQARNLAGIEADVPAQPIAQKIGQIVEDFGDDKIPGAVMRRLESYGFTGAKQTRVFNIREAEKLKTLISNNTDPANRSQMAALSELRKSIDDAMNSIGDDAGSAAAGAFQNARSLAAKRFQTIDRAPGMANAISREQAAPEKFIESYILRGEVQDVANTLRQIPQQQRAEVRAAVLDWLESKAVSGAGDTARLNAAGINKALQSIGERKLDLIFAGDRQALARLQALQRVTGYIQSPPVASGVNYSSSGTTLADFADKATRLPVLNLLGRPGDIMRAQQIGQAVGPANPTRQATPLLSRESMSGPAMLAAQLMGMGSAPAMAGSMQDQNKALARALANR